MSLASPPSPAHQGAETTTFPPAELDRRFTAFAIDRVLAWGLAAGIACAAWLLGSLDVWFAVVVFLLAWVLLGLATAVLVATTGLTPGKALLGLRVVRRADGRPIGLGAALGRTLALGVGGLPTLGLGVATLAWSAAIDPGRRRVGLHDRIGDAVVVDVRPRPVDAPVEDDRPQQIVNLTALRLLPSPSPTPSPTPDPLATGAASAAPPTMPGVALAHLGHPAPPTHRPPTHRAPDAAAPPAPPAAPSAPPAVPSAAHAGSAPPEAATQLRGAAGAATARWRVSFDTGESFVVEGLALVGRRPEARSGEPVRHLVPLRSSDMSLSKTHAQFQVAPDGALVVMDRGSTNGSSIVRKGLAKALTPGRPTTLVDGDEVRFGDRTMQVLREA